MSAIIQSEPAISDMKLPFTSRPITLGLVLLAISCSPLIIDQAVSWMEHLIGKIKSLSWSMEVDGTTTPAAMRRHEGQLACLDCLRAKTAGLIVETTMLVNAG